MDRTSVFSGPTPDNFDYRGTKICQRSSSESTRDTLSILYDNDVLEQRPDRQLFLKYRYSILRWALSDWSAIVDRTIVADVD